jgi:hypothetical protein
MILQELLFGKPVDLKSIKLKPKGTGTGAAGKGKANQEAPQ